VVERRSVALSELLTEQEQIQQLKDWVKQYGLTIVLGIVLALIITSSWRYYQGYRNKQLARASSVYDEMLAARSQNNSEAATASANNLITKYTRSPYANMAAFMLARAAVLKKNYPEAKEKLNWVIDHSSQNSVREIASIRLARVQVAEKHYDEALTTLNNTSDEAFKGLADEVRGDAYLAKNDVASARNAYKLALTELPNAEVTRPLLQMKFDNLALETA